MTKLRAIIVEDSSDDAELLARELRRHGYELTYERVHDADALDTALRHGPWDIVFSDHSMPHFGSGAALQMVRSRDPDVPFLIVAGTMGEDVAVDAMRAGANDYFVKGNFARLPAVVDRELRQAYLEHRVVEMRILNDELTAFAYSVSHDLRAPLRSIDGFSQILLEDHGDQLAPEAREHLGRVRAAASRMGLLIDDLLALSRVSRDEMRSEPVDLARTAGAIVADLRAREPSRQVEVALPAELTATGDARLLRVVLTNLIENAWKFTRKRTPAHITLRGEQRDGELVVSVCDDGAGFDMRYAPKLFGAFQRLHTQDEFEGTGIGLATVQRIVHRHRGRIWAESELGHGATFSFTLPLG